MFHLIALLCIPLVAARTVLVTGATGRTGLPAYLWLQAQGDVEVRGLVRDADKARSELGCDKCDESEGIYIGDVTKKETLAAAMANVDAVIIATASSSNASAVYFDGTWNQIEAFAMAPGIALQNKLIVKVSAALTTKQEVMGKAPSFFYNGVSDQTLSSSGVPFTIIQPCKLNDLKAPAHMAKLLVGHDDRPMADGHAISGPTAGVVSRDDVGHLAAYAAMHQTETEGLKFDLCAHLTEKPEGTEEEEMQRVFREAVFPWDARSNSGPVTV